VQYGRLLKDQGDLPGARAAFKEVLSHRPNWGEAAYRLACIAKTDDERAEVRQLVTSGLASSPNQISLPMFNHAAALVESDNNRRAEFLQTAIDNYETSVQDDDFFEFMTLACKELRKFIPDGSYEARLAKVQSRMRKKLARGHKGA
jgi:hypothetical protein